MNDQERLHLTYFAGMAGIGLLFALQFVSPLAVQVAGLLLLCWQAKAFIDRVRSFEDPEAASDTIEIYDLMGSAALGVRKEPWTWVLVVAGWAGCLVGVLANGSGAFVVSFCIVGVWGVTFTARLLPETARAKEMHAVADQLGLSFRTTLTISDLENNTLWTDFKNVGRVLSHRMRGSWQGYEAEVFDFTSGNENDHHRTAICLRGPQIKLPPLVLRPRAWLVGGVAYGMSEDLARQFTLKSDEQQAGFLFDGDVVPLLTGLPDLVLECGEGKFLMYRDNQPLPSADITRFLQTCELLLDVLHERGHVHMAMPLYQ